MNKDANRDPPSTPATTREAEAAIPAGLEVELLLDDATVITMSTDPVAVLALVPDAAFAVVDSE